MSLPKSRKRPDPQWHACQANQWVLFTTAMDMLNHLLASQVDHSLIRKLKIYAEPALLVVD
jgi:hypothetical protein